MGKHFFTKAVAFAVMAVATLPVQAADAGDKWAPYIELELKPGNDRTIGKLDYFRPLDQDEDTLVYGLLRGTLDDDQSREGNFGLGIRQIHKSDDLTAILGLYGFYDWRRTPTDNSYRQWTLGAELLAENFEARANIYRPENDINGTLSGAAGGLVVIGTQIFQQAGSNAEFALPGYDIEGGVRFDLEDDAFGTPMNLGLYGAYYHFERHGVEIEGPRGRVELMWDNPFEIDGAVMTIGGEVSDDDVRNNTSYGFARLKVPFGEAAAKQQALSVLERRMTRRVIRDTDIVVGEIEQMGAAGGGPLLDVDDNIINVFFVTDKDEFSGDETCSRDDPCHIDRAMDHVTGLDEETEEVIVDDNGLVEQSDIVILLDNNGRSIKPNQTLYLPSFAQIGGGGGDPTNGNAGEGTLNIILNDIDQSTLTLTGLGPRPTLSGELLPSDTLGHRILLMPNAATSTVDGIGFEFTHIGVLLFGSEEPGPMGLFRANNLHFTNLYAETNHASVGMYVVGGDRVELSNIVVEGADVPLGEGASFTQFIAIVTGYNHGTVSIDNILVQDVSSEFAYVIAGLYSINDFGPVSVTNSTVRNISNMFDPDFEGALSVVGMAYVPGNPSGTLSFNNNSFSNFSAVGGTFGFYAETNDQRLMNISGSGNTATNIGQICRIDDNTSPPNGITGSISFNGGADICPSPPE